MSDPLKEFSWGELLYPIKSRVDMRDDALFPLASIRRRNGGFFHRETKLGREILTKTLSKAVSGAFAISRMQVVHGACSYVPESFDETFLSASYTQFQAKNPPRIDTKYLHYYAHLRESYSSFLKSSHGVHIEKMTFDLKDWLRQKVSLPPLPEQKKIASILTSVDEVIETTQKQIDKLQDLKKATMNELLTKGIGHTEFKDSELGRIPKSWEIVEISDIRDKSDRYSFTGGPFGSNLKSEDYTEKGVRIIQLQNIGDGQFLNKYKIFTSKEKADELMSCNIFPGDIILSKMGDPVARATLIPDFDERYLMASDGIRLSVNKNKYDTKFILESINHFTFRNQAELSSTGSTRKRIGLVELRTLMIAIPSLEEQKKLKEVFCSIDDGISNLNSKLSQTQSLKKSLMQDLLTGKVRVQVN